MCDKITYIPNSGQNGVEIYPGDSFNVPVLAELSKIWNSSALTKHIY